MLWRLLLPLQSRKTNTRLCENLLPYWTLLCHCSVHFQTTLTQDLCLAKKSGCWVPKLLSVAQKDQLLWRRLLAVPDKDKSAISFHTLRWSSSPCSGWRKASQALLMSESMLQMVLVFFDASVLSMQTTSGRNCQCLLHQDCSGKIYESFQREGPSFRPRSVFSSGISLQCTLCSAPPLWWSSWRQRGWKWSSPTLFAWPPPSGLFPIPQSEIRASWLDIVPGKLQEQLGGGCQDHHQWGVSCCQQRERYEKCVQASSNYAKR